MGNRKTYQVTKSEDGWLGKAEDNQRASETGSTKQEVQQKTIVMTKNQGNLSVITHKFDGKFQETRTYPKRNDPYPSKGTLNLTISN